MALSAVSNLAPILLAGAGGTTLTLAVTEAGDTLAATAQVAVALAASITEAGDTLVSTAQVGIALSASITEAGDTLSATITDAVSLTASITEQGDTLVASITVSQPDDLAEQVRGSHHHDPRREEDFLMDVALALITSGVLECH